MFAGSIRCEGEATGWTAAEEVVVVVKGFVNMDSSLLSDMMSCLNVDLSVVHEGFLENSDLCHNCLW